MNRSEHLQWAKDRAMEFIENGDLSQGLASFASDMEKHEETANHPALGMFVPLMMTSVINGDTQALKDDINGFN